MILTRNNKRNDPLLQASIDHVLRRDTGTLSADDAAAFAQWRALSEDHEAAARRAERLSALAHSVGRAMVQDAQGAPLPVTPQLVAWPGGALSRRAVLAGAVAASAVAAVGVGTQVIPLGPRPDFATNKGERRVLALADGLKLTLDSMSSANVVHDHGVVRVDLLRGRAGIDANMAGGRAVEARAGAGIARAQNASYDVRLDDDQGCVTCVSGTLDFRYKDRRVTLGGGQALRYDDRGVQMPTPIDPAAASAWQRGLLVFHSVPLADVVREVNRYRPGLVVIRGDIARTPVSGVFYIDSIGEAVAQIEAITGAHAARLPGGLVVLT